MNIFVGNLSFQANERDVKDLFEGFGSVASVKITMEKKGGKSRGFGFVEMPDEQQALAAIAALFGKEFMGRPLNVSPARPKPVAEHTVKSREHPGENVGHKGAWYKHVFHKKKNKYKTGRRTQSFMKRRAASGVAEESTPKPEKRENPMRWRKNYGQAKPWQKSQGKPGPWKRVEGGPKPWKKTDGESKPWKKTEGGPKPWRRKSRIGVRRKSGGHTR